MEGFSVLVVDDEVDFVQTLIKRMRRKGVDCEGVYDGRSAVERIRQRSFDVIVLDMKLADMDGRMVQREIRKLSPETEVVILSGHASASVGREAIAEGARDYLIKPVEFEMLYGKLADVCSKRKV